MSLKGLDAAFRKVVPDFDGFVVASRNHVWLVITMVVFNEVHAAFLVSVEAEVWCRVGDGPDFDSAIKAGGSKGISVFWIDSNIHNVVSVALEDLGVGQTMSRRILVVKQIIDYPVSRMRSMRILVFPHLGYSIKEHPARIQAYG